MTGAELQQGYRHCGTVDVCGPNASGNAVGANPIPASNASKSGFAARMAAARAAKKGGAGKNAKPNSNAPLG